MRQLPRYVSNDDTISDWSLSSKMAKIPTLERLYECGEVLANAKGLTHKVFTSTRSLNPLSCSKFTLRSQAHRAEYEEILLGVQGDDQCKRLSSQFIGRWDFVFIWDFGKLHQNVEMTSFFFASQVLPPLSRPLPAVDRRNARPVRGRQHHDQDAGAIFFISLLFALNCIIICRRSKTCPTSAATPRSRLFPRSPTFSPNSSRWTFQPCRFGHFAKHLTLSRKSSLNISFSRVKTEGRSQW